MRLHMYQNGTTVSMLEDAADVTEEILEKAADVYDGWFASDERIDWEDFIDRLCKWLPDDMDIDEYDNPAVRKIKRHIREIRSQS